MRRTLSICALLLVFWDHGLQSDPGGQISFLGREGDPGPLGHYIVNCHGRRIYQNGDKIDCSVFCDCEEAKEFFKMAGGPDYDPHYLDPDRDGVPCKRLCSK